MKYQALEIVHGFVPKLIIVTLELYSESWSINPIICGGRGGLHRLPLRIIIRHYVGNAPINSKFPDFSQLHSYLHLVKSFFCPKKEQFFDENGQKCSEKFFEVHCILGWPLFYKFLKSWRVCHLEKMQLWPVEHFFQLVRVAFFQSDFL